MIQNFITKLISQLKSNEYHVRYPQLLDKSEKKHVLYLGPYINGTGLYRTIIPATELNKTQTHSAIINQLNTFIPQDKHKPIEWHLSDEMIEWADYIVFPTVTDDLTENIKMLRSINKKPHLKFVFDIDDNYHIPQQGENEKFAQKSRETLLKNMAQCDIITFTNGFLGNFYLKLLHTGKYSNKLPIFLVVPNYMSNDCYENIQITEPKPTKTRIGISVTQTQLHDMMAFRNVLLEVQKTHTDSIELVLFGWNGKLKHNGTLRDVMKGIKFTHIEPVSVDQYFNKLINLQFDFCLQPLQDTTFNSCKSHHKLLQYAQAGIPSIVSDVLPYNEILSPSGKSMFEPGYLPALKCKTNEDWLKKIDYLLENLDSRKNILTKAKEVVNQQFTWHNKQQYLCNVYK